MRMTIMIRWPLGCLIYFLASCTHTSANNEYKLIAADSVHLENRARRAFSALAMTESSIKTGDLVTRTGNDFTSQSLRSLNRRNTTYSHCGIAIIENDSLFIYHALGGEFNPDQTIRRDPFLAFSEPYSNNGIGVFRYELSGDQVNGIIDKVRDAYYRGVEFDMHFNLGDTTEMYCAEFVEHCYTLGSKQALVFPHSFIKSFEFIGVDDLYLHPAARSVHSLMYK